MKHSDNPLVQHRGQPSTHDVELGQKILQSLKSNQRTEIPIYDKSAFNGEGDRVKGNCRTILADERRADLVILEGWCVGFRAVHDGLSEKDPTTTAWEGSKALLATGKVATMYLGSWAIQQMKDAATTAGKNPDDIGYMPFPYQVDGKYVATIAPDYFSAINKKSNNKASAPETGLWYSLHPCSTICSWSCLST